MKELINIQSELKAPKNQYNKFGKFNYRSCEDILEAVKPLLFKNNCQLTITDEIVNFGERFYIKATAKIINKSGEEVENTAFAREDSEKKGMDGSQITGTASSYARKYCLNGLFLIDDSKDADTDEFKNIVKEEKPKASEKQIELVNKLVEDKEKMLEYYEISKVEDLTMEQASKIISNMKKKKGE